MRDVDVKKCCRSFQALFTRNTIFDFLFRACINRYFNTFHDISWCMKLCYFATISIFVSLIVPWGWVPARGVPEWRIRGWSEQFKFLLVGVMNRMRGPKTPQKSLRKLLPRNNSLKEGHLSRVPRICNRRIGAWSSSRKRAWCTGICRCVFRFRGLALTCRSSKRELW